MIIIWKHQEDYGNTTEMNHLWIMMTTINFGDDNTKVSFKFKPKTTGQRDNDGTKKVEKIMPLQHLSNFWRTLEMSLINYKINLILTWFENSVISPNTNANQSTTTTITDTILISTNDNAKLLQQLK